MRRNLVSSVGLSVGIKHGQLPIKSMIRNAWRKRYRDRFNDFAGAVNVWVTISCPMSKDCARLLARSNYDGLLRRVLSALTGAAYSEAARIEQANITKLPRPAYCEQPHIRIVVEYFTDERG